jgi:hypothetical protein
MLKIQAMLGGKESLFYSPPALSASGRFARAAEFAEEIFFFSAERAEKKKIYALMLSKRHSGGKQ